MDTLTPRQRDVLDFIESTERETGQAPSLREIAAFFGYRSVNAARDHVRALTRKGALDQTPRRPRALRPRRPDGSRRRPLADVPLYGAIPAGFADTRQQDPIGCVSVDVDTLGIRPTPRTFALQVTGDSMEGRHILDGDVVVCEHGVDPRPGDVVAALIDSESTLKTFVRRRGKTYLKAENPRYPELVPAEELVIQGVVVAVLRRVRAV